MAAIATQSVEHVDKVALKVIVDKERNKIVFAEAGKDFVDALFSFLTLPLGTIARLVAKESSMQSVSIGSLSSLYQSVADFKDEYLWTQTCKEMLLEPRNSLEAYCHKMKLNIDDTPMHYFSCEELNCNRKGTGTLLSTFKNQKCVCGKVMDEVVSTTMMCLENGFVKETSSFIICDDLHVMPNTFGTSIDLLQKLGVCNIDAIEERMVHISKIEVVDLLSLAMLSKTPLTDLILKEKQLNSGNKSEFEIGEVPSSEGRQISVKMIMRKSTGEILFAEGEQDFANFLLSFLAFPLGRVLHMLNGSSSISCMDNLYKSLNELNPDIFLKSQEVKDKLTKPQCFPKFELRNQILQIDIAELPVHYCHTYYNYVNCNYVYHIEFTKEKLPNHKEAEKFVPFELADPKFCNSKSSTSGEFVKESSLYMVTDDLVVSPISSVSALSCLIKSKVPLFDLEERVIKIGLKEGLSLLKASLISTSALTTGLKQFTRDVKEEK